MADGLSDAGFRALHFPASTSVRNSPTALLNASGSSMLMVWPLLGITSSPAGNHALHEDAWLQAGLILVPSHNERGDRKRRSCSSNSYTRPSPLHPLHGARRRYGVLSQLVGEFPPASGILSSNWTRVGPLAYTAATARIPSRSNVATFRSPAGNADVRLPRNVATASHHEGACQW